MKFGGVAKISKVTECPEVSGHSVFLGPGFHSDYLFHGPVKRGYRKITRTGFFLAAEHFTKYQYNKKQRKSVCFVKC